MRKFLSLVAIAGLVFTTSCDKQDDNIEFEVLETSAKEISFNLELPSKTSKMSFTSQEQVLLTYEQAGEALLSLQSQDDFFNNGVINNAIAYINSRINLLSNNELTSLDTIIDNLYYIVSIVDAQIELYRESLGNFEIAAPVIEKQLDEAPFRMFESVPVNMNGTVVTLEGIEIVQKYVKQGSSDFYTYKFVVFGENVELLPAAVISWDTGKNNVKEVKANKSITAINDGYVDQVGVEFTVDFVGVTEVFKF